MHFSHQLLSTTYTLQMHTQRLLIIVKEISKSSHAFRETARNACFRGFSVRVTAKLPSFKFQVLLPSFTFKFQVLLPSFKFCSQVFNGFKLSPSFRLLLPPPASIKKTLNNENKIAVPNVSLYGGSTVVCSCINCLCKHFQGPGERDKIILWPPTCPLLGGSTTIYIAISYCSA